VEFTPDGLRLITGSRDATARVWSMDGTLLGQFTGHTGEFGRPVNPGEAGAAGQRRLGLITDLCVLPGTRRVLSAGNDYSARLWDADSLRSLSDPLGHASSVTAVLPLVGGHVACTGAHSGKVKFWVLSNPRASVVLRGHQGLIFDMAFDPTGERIVTGSSDGTVRLWDVRTGRELNRVGGHPGEVRAVAFSPDGNLVATGGRQGRISLWDVGPDAGVRELKREGDAVISLAFAPEGSRLAVGYWQQPAEIWEVSEGRELLRVPVENKYVCDLAFSPVGRLLALAGAGPVCVVNVADGQDVQSFDELEHATAVAFSKDGKRIAAGSLRGRAVVWGLADRDPVCTFSGHTERVWCLAFGPLGRQVVTGDQRGLVKLWDADTAEEVLTLPEAKAPVRSLAFSPDGIRLALVQENEVLILSAAPWNETVRQIRERKRARLLKLLRD
jgi:WD40 repeat protein